MEPTIECPNCRNVYERRSLHCPSCNQIGVPKLYKYLPFNHHSLSILINKQIWCPKAKTLNDPFEYQLHFPATSYGGISIDLASVESAKEDIKELGVICLSEIDNNILMWSHYAEGHAGFCIEFERTDDNELGNRNLCLPVTYDSAEVPTFDHLQLEKEESIAKIVRTKAPGWSYEIEWRLIVRRESANTLIPLPAKISSVTFGCEMDNTRRLTVANILRRDVLYFEAIKKKDHFSLDIKQILFEALGAF